MKDTFMIRFITRYINLYGAVADPGFAKGGADHVERAERERRAYRPNGGLGTGRSTERGRGEAL